MVTVVDNNDCEDTQTFELTNGSPEAPVIGAVENMVSVPDIYETYQWLWNGNAIAGAEESTYEATVSGAYSVVVTSAEGCSVTSGEVDLVVNSLEDLQLTELTVRPNPFGQKVIVQAVASGHGNYRFEVRDLTGRVVFQATESFVGRFEKTIVLSDIPAGTYILILEKEGKKVFKKINKG